MRPGSPRLRVQQGKTKPRTCGVLFGLALVFPFSRVDRKNSFASFAFAFAMRSFAQQTRWNLPIFRNAQFFVQQSLMRLLYFHGLVVAEVAMFCQSCNASA